MTRHPGHKSAGKLLRSLYLWHRWIGLAAVVFVIVLAVSGLALNHTDELQLDASFVQSPALLNWYGIHAPDNITSYTAGPLTISALGNDIYNNTTRLPNLHAPLVGAVEFGGLIVVATTDKLLLLTISGELVEQLDSAAGVPGGIRAIGITTDNMLTIRTMQGNYTTDTDFTAWHETTTPDVAWVSPVTPAENLLTGLRESYRGNGLPLERVILDLHSGRIMGSWGIYVMDAAAILCLLLAFSGVWLWGKRRTSARTHRRKIKIHNN
jgi:hypothetical protein